MFVFTSLPAQKVPSVGMGDKFEHSVAYSGLSFLLSFTLRFQKRFKSLSSSYLLSALIIATIYGAFDEIHQLFITGRSCELNDFIADFIGALIGIAFAFIIIYSSEKKRYSAQENYN